VIWKYGPHLISFKEVVAERKKDHRVLYNREKQDFILLDPVAEVVFSWLGAHPEMAHRH
jgi:hypothetical protein